jgi:hypothetical protein
MLIKTDRDGFSHPFQRDHAARGLQNRRELLK